MAKPLITIILDELSEDGSSGSSCSRISSQGYLSLHQCLLMLLDSPLNQAGYLELYIRLADRRLISIHREVRVPRTFKRFNQLFDNFLQGCDMPVVQTKDGPARLFKFINKPLDKLLLANEQFHRFRISNLTARLARPSHFAQFLETEAKRLILLVDLSPVDFNFLGNSKESDYEIKVINNNPDKDTYSISRYPISPALICVKLTSSFERALDVFWSLVNNNKIIHSSLSDGSTTRPW